MLSVHNVADYFLAQMSEEAGDTISPLKLQKLVYYAQGFHLAVIGDPLFSQPIMAWEHGPVVVDLYHRFKDVGSGAIPKPEIVDFDVFTSDQIQILNQVNEIFGQFSGWKLRNMTHEEPTWKNTPRNKEIPHEALRQYFKTQVEE